MAKINKRIIELGEYEGLSLDDLHLAVDNPSFQETQRIKASNLIHEFGKLAYRPDYPYKKDMLAFSSGEVWSSNVDNNVGNAPADNSEFWTKVTNKRPDTSGALPETIVVNGTTWGSIKDGDTLTAGTSFFELFKRGLIVAQPVTYLAPALSLNVSGAAPVVEVGTSVDIAASANYNQRDGGNCTGVAFKRNGVTQATDSTAPYTYDPLSFVIGQETISYRATATYEAGPIKNNNLGEPQPDGQIQSGSVDSNTVNIKGARAGFFGVDNPDNTSASVRALAKHVLDIKQGDKIILPIPAGATKVTFVLEDSLPAPSSVLYMEGNVQVKGNFEVSATNVRGANNYALAPYKVYTYIPAAPFVGDSNYEITI